MGKALPLSVGTPQINVPNSLPPKAPLFPDTIAARPQKVKDRSAQIGTDVT
jgi:hypothetical protein